MSCSLTFYGCYFQIDFQPGVRKCGIANRPAVCESKLTLRIKHRWWKYSHKVTVTTNRKVSWFIYLFICFFFVFGKNRSISLRSWMTKNACSPRSKAIVICVSVWQRRGYCWVVTLIWCLDRSTRRAHTVWRLAAGHLRLYRFCQDAIRLFFGVFFLYSSGASKFPHIPDLPTPTSQPRIISRTAREAATDACKAAND